MRKSIQQLVEKTKVFKTYMQETISPFFFFHNSTGWPTVKSLPNHKFLGVSSFK